MIRLTNALKVIPILLSALACAACSGGNVPSSSATASNVHSSPSLSASPSSDANAATSSPEAGSPSASGEASGTVRPQTESFDLMTGGDNPPRTATLERGKGFSLYVFEGFAFDAATGRLALTANPDYHVDIEPLPTDYDEAKLRKAGEEELADKGKVSDYSGELAEHPLGYAEVYLQASGADGISDYIIWKSKAGDSYLFRLHNPKSDETLASNFAAPVLASMSTVQGE